MGFDKSLLVTGAGGQLGRALARLVPDATFLDRRALDVTDRDAVLEAVAQHRPEVIVQAAAYTKVDAAEADPQGARAINADGAQAVANAAEKAGALFVYPSTDYVFSGDKLGPYREDDPTGPLSVYGSTKLDGEKAAASAGAHLIVRTSWVYGEGHNFIRTIAGVAAKHRELRVIDDQTGRPTYSFDLAEGILGLVSRGATGVFHLAGGAEPATWADLAEAVISIKGLGARVLRVSTSEYYSGRDGAVAPRPANSVLDCGKAAALGVSLRPWRDGLAAYLEEMQ